MPHFESHRDPQSAEPLALLTIMEFYQDQYSSDKGTRYVAKEKLGEGAFGEVRKATDTVTGDIVAVKYVRIMSRNNGLPKAVFRELESLRQLSEGRHIVRLVDVYAEETKLCLVMEYIEADLADVISKTRFSLPISHVKSYASMMLKALDYVHSRNLIHRDVKPSNFMITSKGIVKLGDFGLTRVYDANLDANGSMSHQVATRQYRAPELLFASRRYDQRVDVWSCAVIIVELLTLLPLFPGNNDIDQMYRVFQVMGSPTVDVWPGVDQLPDYCKVSFPNMVAKDLLEVMPCSSAEDRDFVGRLLVLDPKQRLTSAEACQHPYLSEQASPPPVHPSSLVVPRREPPTKRPKLVSSVEEMMAVLGGAGNSISSSETAAAGSVDRDRIVGEGGEDALTDKMSETRIGRAVR